MTEIMRTQRLRVLLRGCARRLLPHQSPSQRYLPTCHAHGPLHLPLETLPMSAGAQHTRLLSTILADPCMQGRRDLLNINSFLLTRRGSEGGDPFLLQNHTPPEAGEAAGEAREREPVVEVLGGNSRSIVQRCEGDGRKAGVLVETEEEGRQMIVVGWMIGRSPALDMARLLATIPDKIGAPLAREV
jgi:hypothetical protein